MPDYPGPTFDGIRLIFENFGKEYPDAPRSQRVRRRLLYRAAQTRTFCGKFEVLRRTLRSISHHDSLDQVE